MITETQEEKKATQAAYTALDEVDGGTQALLLPATLAALLASSFFFLTIGNAPPPPEAGPNAFAEALSPLARALPLLSSAGVCLLFTRSELAAAFESLRSRLSPPSTDAQGADGATERIPLAAAAALVGACYLGPAAGVGAWVWPLQNIVNSCLAVTILTPPDNEHAWGKIRVLGLESEL